MKKFGVFTLTCFFLIAALSICDLDSAFGARRDVEAFVSRFYQECLGENPDPDDLNGWVSGLMNGSLTAADVAYAFLFGDKFINQNITHEEYLYILYRVLLNRDPDREGYRKHLSDLSSGNNRFEIVNRFLDSKDFSNIYCKLGILPRANIQPMVAAGHFHTVGLKADGTVVAVGNNNSGQLKVGGWRNIKQVAAGGDSTVGLKGAGTVVAVGRNGAGQLNVGGWRNIKQVSSHYFHTVGLKADGTVVAVGENGYGQRNVGSWRNIKQLSASVFHTVGLKADGTVVAVGLNHRGQLKVGGWRNIKQVSAGFRHTVGLKMN